MESNMGKIVKEDLKKIQELALELFGENKTGSVRRLGGLTNHTYAVELSRETLVFRMPGEGTEKLINRKDEKISAELAGRLGIDADVVYMDDTTGIKITRYVEEAETMSPISFQRTDSILKAAEILKRLHHSGEDTGVAFEVFEMAQGYEKLILDNGISFYPDYFDKKHRIEQLKQKIPAPKKVTCHNDPLCENWIRDKNRLYLIDWEYAGMNDPLWDLADLSIEAGLDEEKDRMLLEAYNGNGISEETKLRFMMNKVYIDFLWSLWGKARVPFEGSSMEEYAACRYARMNENLQRINEG